MLVITIIAGRESFLHDICFFYRASLGGPDERREQKFATLVGESFRNATHKYFTHTEKGRVLRPFRFALQDFSPVIRR